jgi:DNA-binding NarL/FixJ family response regulator
MKQLHHTLFVSHDQGLIAHWQTAFEETKPLVIGQMDEFFRYKSKSPCVVWLDVSLPMRPNWDSASWTAVLQNDRFRVIAASSNPNDNDAMLALDAGCVAYCHAFSDSATLKQIRDVVDAGQVWIGKNLMQRLLHGVSQLVPKPATPDTGWREGLTVREVEIATLAANGATNQAIAMQCQISERTVKAHLSAVFVKLNITDRLQLALRVHGIH